MVKTRSFIAVNLPGEIKNYLETWMTEIKNKIGNGVKWVEKENLHLTLHFLGDLENEELEKVKDILKKTIVPKEIKLKIGPTGCFPHQNNPRILFFQCEENKNNYLRELQQKIGRELQKSGFNIDQRPWQMHLTFGRVKSPIKIPDSFKKETASKEFLIQSIDLMKSNLQPGGPVYTILEKYSLII